MNDVFAVVGFVLFFVALVPGLGVVAFRAGRRARERWNAGAEGSALGYGVLALVAGWLCLGFAEAIFRIYASAKVTASQKSRNDLRAKGRAINLYMEAHDGRFPLAHNWEVATEGRPSDPSRPLGMNGRVAGVSIVDTYPSTVLVFPSVASGPNAIGQAPSDVRLVDGRAQACLVDGSIKSYGKADAMMFNLRPKRD